MRLFFREGLKIFAPSVYWKRRLRRFQIFLLHHHEAEIQLLPYLCSGQKLSVDVGADYGGWAISMAQYSKSCKAA
jgi:hypothetical protein